MADDALRRHWAAHPSGSMSSSTNPLSSSISSRPSTTQPQPPTSASLYSLQTQNSIPNRRDWPLSRRSEDHPRFGLTNSSTNSSTTSLHSTSVSTPAMQQNHGLYPRDQGYRHTPNLSLNHFSQHGQDSPYRTNGQTSTTTHPRGTFAEPYNQVSGPFLHRLPGSSVASAPASSTSAGIRTADSSYNISTSSGGRPARKGGSAGSGGILAAGVDVKRLMSKPTAVTTPNHYISSHAARTGADSAIPSPHDEDNLGLQQSSNDYYDRYSTTEPLRIGRRRSRTMDSLLLANRQTSLDNQEFTTLESSTSSAPASRVADENPLGLSLGNNPPRQQLRRGAQTDPNIPILPPDKVQSTTARTSSVDAVGRKSTSNSALASGNRSVTPASAMVLAWNEAQRAKGNHADLESLSDYGDDFASDARPSGTYRNPTWSHSTPFSDLLDFPEHGNNHPAVQYSTAVMSKDWQHADERLQSQSQKSGSLMKDLTRRVTGRLSKAAGKDRKDPASPAFNKVELDQNVIIPRPRGVSLSNQTSGAVSGRKSFALDGHGHHPTLDEPAVSAVEYHLALHQHGDASHFHPSPQPPYHPSNQSYAMSSSTSHRSRSPGRMSSVNDPEGSGRLWKLVRKLSTNGLRREGSISSGSHGDVLESSSRRPPVPPIPKDFELVDSQTLQAEREKERRAQEARWPRHLHEHQYYDGPDSSGSQTTFRPSIQSPPLTAREQDYGGFSSALRGRETLPTPITPSTFAASPPTSPKFKPPSKPKHRVSAALAALDSSAPPKAPKTKTAPSSNAATAPPTSQPPTGQPPALVYVNSYTRPHVVQSHAQSQHSYTTSLSGNSSSIPSSSSRNFEFTPYSNSRRSSISSYGEQQHQSTQIPQSALGRHILPPDQLFKMREEEVRQIAEGTSSSTRPRVDSDAQPQARPRPPTKSMTLPRPVSSPPISPNIPTFTHDAPSSGVTSFPSREKQDQPRKSFGDRMGWDPAGRPSSSSSSFNASAESTSPRMGPMVLSPPPSQRRFASQRATYHESVSAEADQRRGRSTKSYVQPPLPQSHGNMYQGDEHVRYEEAVRKGQKLKVNTSSGLMAKVRSVRGPKSAHSQTGSAKGRMENSPIGDKKAATTSPHFSSPSERGSPAVPFTGTAFVFKELNEQGSKHHMSEREREDKWEELLALSERAGGTLTAKIDGGMLMSDQMSVAGGGDEDRI